MSGGRARRGVEENLVVQVIGRSVVKVAVEVEVAASGGDVGFNAQAIVGLHAERVEGGGCGDERDGGVVA